MLVLEIEYPTGVAVAASAYDRAAAEWPPHPDRVFSALVSAWAERGQDEPERTALEWLERLDAPLIIPPDAGRRQVPDVYVPPNGLETPPRDMQWLRKLRAGVPLNKKTGEVSAFRRARAVLPAERTNRQARQFPAVVLPGDETRVWLLWKAAEEETIRHRPALERLLDVVPYLGHSSSLVRLRSVTKGGSEPTHVPDAVRLAAPIKAASRS